MTIRFGTDGWRAVIAEEFTFAAVREVARALGSVVRSGSGESRPTVVVGFDRRFASDAFARAAAQVLAEAGVEVALCREPVPSPLLSHAVVDARAAAALIITASHNPPQFNGIKLKSETGASPSSSWLRSLETELANPSAALRPDDTPAGQIRELDPFTGYVDRVARLVDLNRIRTAGLTIVVDAMFGTAAGILPRLIGGDATTIVEINTAHNPLFPGIGGPEPVERNLGRLKKVVADGSAHLGFAFDGDGDRLGVIDERGEYVSAQHIFALLARYIVAVRGERGPIVKAVSGTMMVDAIGNAAGVPVIETATGFSHIAEAMIAEQASIGGEESGGFGFGFHFPDRDALLAALLLIDYTVQSGRRLSQLLEELETATGSWRFRRLDVPLPVDALASAGARLHELSWPPSLAGLNVTQVIPLDGVRVEFEDGSWLLARPSGTEPVFRLYAEAHTPDTVDQLLHDARELLRV